MIIKKIRIRNFRNIKNLELDFTANSAGSEANLMNGNFVKMNSGKVIPQVISLIGPNAVGKTNILKALAFFNYMTSNELNFDVARKVLLDSIENKTDINEKELRKKTVEMIENINSKDADISEVEAFLTKKRNAISSIFSREASNKEKPINIEIEFWDIKKQISLKAFLMFGDHSMKKQIPDELKNMDKWVNISDQAPFYLNEAFGMRQPFFVRTDIVKNLLETFGSKKLLNLINIADPSISSVFKKDNKILFGSSNSSLDIDFEALSSGTKRYIYLIEFIIRNAKSKKGVFLIDEIELNLHRELAMTLIQAMNMVAKINKNVTFIFTTHNPMILGQEITYKQVLEIKEDVENNCHIATKLSTLFKAHESIEKKYMKGIISRFPAASYAFDNLYKVINE